MLLSAVDVEVGLRQAARLTLVQLLINSKGLQMNPLQSLYYISPACLLCLSLPLGAPGQHESWRGARMLLTWQVGLRSASGHGPL